MSTPRGSEEPEILISLTRPLFKSRFYFSPFFGLLLNLSVQLGHGRNLPYRVSCEAKI
jgi:hypothetical protein